MNQPTPDDAHRILQSLEEEIGWLEQLETLSAAVRDASLEPTGQTLPPLLTKKTALIDKLAARRDVRARMLKRAKQADGDLLVMVLALVDKAQHADVAALFSRYVEAQERAAREVAKSRDFFEVALDVVEEMRDAIVPREDAQTYDRTGVASGPAKPIAVSQLT